LRFSGRTKYVPAKVKDVIGDDDMKISGCGAETLYRFMPDRKFVPFLAS
jgi:hypothetical protein